MQNAGMEEFQAGIKISGRNINDFRYADDTILMAETEEELKSLLMRVKEKSEKADLKFNTQKTNIMASRSITSWQADGGNYWKMMETVRFHFLGLQNQCGHCNHGIKRCLLLGRKAVTNLDSVLKSRDITS